MKPRDLQARIRELGPWFHNMELAGVMTAPDHLLGDFPRVLWQAWADALPQDLTGASVLDVGCNAGFYAIEMKRRGARRVVGIDSDDRYLAQARLAAELSEVELELRRMSVYQVPDLGERFDLVLFMGVLDHLRYPLLALDLLRRHAVAGTMVFQSLQRGSREVEPVAADYPFVETAIFDAPGYPRLHFVEHAYAGDWTRWWIPNAACTEAMLRSAGFRITAHPEEGIYFCELDEEVRDDRFGDDLERAQRRVAPGHRDRS